MTLSTLLARESDEALVKRAQGGDSPAFDELVRRYTNIVYRILFKILRHEEDTQDALQDTFVSAYRALPRFRQDARFSTWIYRIATNAALMKARARRANLVSLDHPSEDADVRSAWELPDWSATPDEEILTDETRRIMEDAIQALPTEQRAAFVLHDLQDLSSAETAEAMGITVSAVNSRLHRARVFLRDRIGRYLRNPDPALYRKLVRTPAPRKGSTGSDRVADRAAERTAA
ncbi:MAG: RNA polymerase sigma factor [Candidatus Eiseniibacteriota bacterium]